MFLEPHNHVALWPLFFALAGLVGFVAERASLCTVKAVKEILSTRRAYMLWCFAKTVLWVIGISIILAWGIEAPGPVSLGFSILVPGLLGGVIFGVGAVLNRACSLSTLTRLGSGDLGMITTLVGFVLGVTINGLIEESSSWMTPIRAAPWFDLNDGSAWVLGVTLSLWMLWESIRLWRTAPKTHWKKLLATQSRLSTAAAILGVSNGILMGFGAKLVPGGNDVLLLNAIPGFSPHALPAYFAMLIGIAITLTILKWFGGEWHKVDCEGDLCQESNKV